MVSMNLGVIVRARLNGVCAVSEPSILPSIWWNDIVIKTMGAKKCETAKKTMGKVRKNYGKMSLAQKNEPNLNFDAMMMNLIG